VGGIYTHLEENGVFGVSPEVGDGIAAVAATGQYLETARALSVGTRLTWNRKTLIYVGNKIPVFGSYYRSRYGLVLWNSKVNHRAPKMLLFSES
jgi:hypothetical protein